MSAFSFRHESRVAPAIGCLIFFAGTILFSGCSDDIDEVRKIQTQRQVRMQAQSQQDHLGEAFELLSRIVDLNADKAQRQIAYHLNQWLAERAEPPTASAPELLATISDLLPADIAAARIEKDRFVPADINHLRDCYLFRQVVNWINTANRDDIVLQDWLQQQEQELGLQLGDQLRTAARLFDWTVRNIAFEPLEEPGGVPPGLNLPYGMTFQGAGYRQSDYQSLWRGTGDAWQRAGVFTKLCQQASLRSAVLAVQSTETGELTPWCVGVFIGDEVYLFEPNLGIHIPGPGQVGIATLKQARSDAAVMRRLAIAGFFDYSLTKEDIQQNIALLNLLPEAVSPRMKILESGLTGNRRMSVYVDADATAEELDEAAGIAGVRLWKVPLLAEVYRVELEKQAERDPQFLFWYLSRWAIMDGGNEMADKLSRGRWRHLTGQFDDQEDSNLEGARTLYLGQRAPEFEIADLDIDVNLQKAYGIRRELRASPELYKQQVKQVQVLMRLGKRTATYWLSLLQYDDGRLETAGSWLEKRVLNEEQLSRWEPAARYNLARTLERLGETERAIALYKTVGDPQEHGNRVRARLLAKLGDEE
jgi:hypothetical protein